MGRKKKEKEREEEKEEKEKGGTMPSKGNGGLHGFVSPDKTFNPER